MFTTTAAGSIECTGSPTGGATNTVAIYAPDSATVYATQTGVGTITVTFASAAQGRYRCGFADVTQSGPEAFGVGVRYH